MSKAMPKAARVMAGVVMLLTLAIPAALYAGGKKKKEEPPKQPNILDVLDYSKIVWPNPPAVTRIKYLNYFCCDKFEVAPEKKKNSWMDRMAGGESQQQKQALKPLFALWTPYGLAEDSKGNLYVADGKVGAVFVFNTETKELRMIKHGVQARFGDIIGLAIDDSDRLFVSDTKLHRILVFDKDHKVEGTIAQGLVDPGGMVVDNENRFLYVADAAQDLVLVFDADKLTFIRKIGTAGKNHTLTDSGQFSVPTNVALDADNNLYVSDTYNDRIEVFDADGNFIRQFGKAGDRPGKFTRPKGIAIDVDGHVWVADAVQDRVQCFTPEGDLLIWMGGHGTLPGQFRTLAGLYIDKNNRIFTSEQYPGRVQMFRYFTDEEARAELARRQEAEKGKSNGAKPTSNAAAASSAAQKPQ
ncbi:MAG TPA: 6-bladed beta-propeller [Candidatus Sulfotelmatobacter sp.]|nr:6-bladed beta-propeller [Candidatus Sulfotelmatobacter sp.]